MSSIRDRQLLFHQVNITNKEHEIEYFKELESQGFFLLGIEITDPDIQNAFHMNIDPQHDPTNKTDITSIEYTFNYHDNIYSIINEFDKVLMATNKPDMDSIGAMSILTLLLYKQFHIDGDMILRLKAIAKSDRHGRSNWKNRKEDHFHFENYNIHGLPSGLAYMTSDHRIETVQKVRNMIDYLTSGSFDTLDKYNHTVMKNLKRSNKNTDANVVVPKKLVLVTSNYRGAVAYGYKFAATVIAKNNNFVFGIGQTKKHGKKYTIAQYEDSKYIDLNGLVKELNKLEPGWGGSSVIIGSPLDAPSKLDDNTIIELTKQFLY